MIPEADWPLGPSLVESLLAAQFPGWAGPVTEVASGWDNALFRLGDRWVVRLPRRASSVPLLEKEARWLPTFGPLPLAIPTLVGQGQPSAAFPHPWTIHHWLPGTTADQGWPHDDQAEVLAGFWRALHRTPPADAPVNPFRGGPLSDRIGALEERLARLSAAGQTLDPLVADTWNRALAAPVDLPPTWIHADLHPRNVLVEGGRLTAVLDWGDLAAGDPATDLAATWMLLETPEAQDRALGAYGASEATLRRALGWAVVFGVMFLDAGLTSPGVAPLGQTILGRVVRFRSRPGSP